MEETFPERGRSGLDDAAGTAGQTFDTFLPDDGNAEALEAVRLLLRGDEKRIIIWGETGCGKTHLLKAVYRFVKETFPAAQVRYLHGSDFVEGMIRSIRAPGHARSRSDLFAGLEYLLIDDIRCLEGKPGLQREFLNCLERAGEDCRIIMTSDRRVDGCWDRERAIRRKLEQYRSVQIRDEHPDLLLDRRMALTRKLCADMGIEMPEDMEESKCGPFAFPKRSN